MLEPVFDGNKPAGYVEEVEAKCLKQHGCRPNIDKYFFEEEEAWQYINEQPFPHWYTVVKPFDENSPMVYTAYLKNPMMLVKEGFAWRVYFERLEWMLDYWSGKV